MNKLRKPSMSLLQILSLGLAAVILLGTALLMLPVASRDGNSIAFIDALFTATSATCVTGLTVFDIYTQFTLFGQAVMLGIIQIGGLSFMSIGVLFSLALGKRIGLKERTLMKESMGALKLGGIVRLVRLAILGTFIFELAGAVLLCFRFCPEFGLVRGIWFGVFHSVSAFCNAGFDLIGRVAPSTSLSRYAGDPLVNFVVMALIVVGGLGFIVWDDLRQQKWRFKKYSLQTKIVVLMTGILLAAGTAGFYFTESGHAFADLRPGEKILAAMFQSVTARTAGFYTVDMTALSEGGTFLTILLMFIGASPGSTGGGLKTTTFFVILFSVIAFLRDNDDVNVFNRKIGQTELRKAFSAAALFTAAAALGTLVITLQGADIGAAMFEAMSAIATVGLSKNLSPSLTAASKLTVIALMYMGRLGSISVIMAITDRRVKTKISNIEEKIAIG